MLAVLSTEEWQEKIERYTKFVHVPIKSNPTKASSTEVAVQAEGERVAKCLGRQVLGIISGVVTQGQQQVSAPCFLQ